MTTPESAPAAPNSGAGPPVSPPVERPRAAAHEAPVIPPAGQTFPRARPPRSARELAYAALTAAGPGMFVSEAFATLDDSAIGAADRAFARELALGVVRRAATLDAVLRTVVARPQESLEPELWTVLRIGAYQLLLLPETPPHAAVHETVELAKRLGRPRWTGFLNGVLRSVARLIAGGGSAWNPAPLAPTPGADDARGTGAMAEWPAADAVPVVRLVSVGDATHEPEVVVRPRRLTRSVLPDPAHDFDAWIEAAYGVPAWLAARWRKEAGDQECERRAAWFATPGVLTLRVNPLRTSREALRSALAAAGVEVAPGASEESLRAARSGPIEKLPGFAEGWFCVQDEAALEAVRLLDPRPGEQILDLCAGPGGKTAQLAERMHNEGRIVACDIDAERLRPVAETAARLGLDCISCQVIRTDGGDVPVGPFDAVLVDAPCSNTGVMGKRPEVRSRLVAAELLELAALQRALLETAAARLRPGGRLVYSTCSIEARENQDVVAEFLATHPEFVLSGEVVRYPGRPADGAYAARLEMPG